MSESANLSPDDSGGAEGPVTVSITRRVVAGREAEYEAWLKGITAEARRFPGHQGVNILRPSAQTGGRYVLIYRFGTWAQCDAWERSDLRAVWVSKLGDLVEGAAEMRRVTGLEAWFDLPEVPVSKPAPRWKMALVLIVVIFALVYPLQLLAGAFLSHWPRPFVTLTVAVIQVCLMTWVVMPPVTRALRKWLFS